MVALDHVFGVGFEHAAIRAGLAEDFAEHFEVEAESVTDAEAFGQGGGIDIHDHVDECFHLGGPAGRADVVERVAHVVEERLGAVEESFVATNHEEKLAVARLGYTGGHAGFEALGPGFSGGRIELVVHGRRERSAVDESAALGSGEEAILAKEDGFHRFVIGHYGQDDVRIGGDVGELFAGGRTDFRCEFAGDV